MVIYSLFNEEDQCMTELWETFDKESSESFIEKCDAIISSLNYYCEGGQNIHDNDTWCWLWQYFNLSSELYFSSSMCTSFLIYCRYFCMYFSFVFVVSMDNVS